MAQKKTVKGKDKEKKPVRELNKRQELNNHIVCMRNTVTQARIQIINRLIHQVKKYKCRKGNDNEQEKAKKKAERLIEEIQALKKLKKDKASLYALQDTNDPGSILSDPSSCLEERVLSRLSHHNLIKAKVRTYRDANPNWDKQIPVLLRMTRLKRKKKTDEQEESHAENNLTLAEKQLKLTDDEEEEEKDSTETRPDQIKVKNEIKKIPKPKTLVLKTESVEKADVDSDNETKPQVQPRNLNKVEGTVTVKLLKDLNDLEAEETGSRTLFPDVTQPAKSRKPKSGFFVGGVDEPEDFSNNFEKKFSAPKSNNFGPSNGNQSKGVFRKGKLISKGPPSGVRGHQKLPSHFNERNSYHRNGDYPQPVSKQSRFPPKGTDRFAKGNDRDYSRAPAIPNSNSNPAAVPPEKLHPSWEAKKKQQQITAFEGKRIVFNEDD